MRLASTIGINMAGQVIRMAIAVAIVPLYTAWFGAARFGSYFFLLALMPYFQVHALATARQVTTYTARVSRPADDGARAEGHAGLDASMVLGIGGSVVLTTALLVLYPWLTASIEGSPELANEASRARPWAAAIVLLDIVILIQLGQMEGRGRFAASNVSQVIGQLAALLLPIVPLIYDGSLDRLMAGVAAGRLLQAGVALRWAPFRDVLPSFANIGQKIARIGREFSLMTVTAMCNAASKTLDRIIVGASASASALYFYAAPAGAAARLSVVGLAMGTSLAPRFAVADHAEGSALAGHASDAALALTLPVCLFGILFADPILTLWVDAGFASQAGDFFRIALAGVIGTTIAQLPAILLQSTGRARAITIQHVIEIVPFAAALYWASGLSLTAVALAVAARNFIAGAIHMVLARMPVRSIVLAFTSILLLSVCILLAPEWDRLIGLWAIPAKLALVGIAPLAIAAASPGLAAFMRRLVTGLASGQPAPHRGSQE
ncbi:MATE family efflux transporter [Parerythrobacter aestuarii]|uniref:hypothetical protein n=1 Tax=Parerythrobacter aestuarii TaxID=3020909 RepID=UPI0024DE5B7D|nr:hypothetical protein [Parerythrobacter aestuarii]